MLTANESWGSKRERIIGLYNRAGRGSTKRPTAIPECEAERRTRESHPNRVDEQPRCEWKDGRMNIAAETVTVVLENPTDWAGPAVGIIGVVLGSLMGLAGIRWQHDAQRAYDVRKLCAVFIHDGEFIRDGYLGSANVMLVSEVAPFLRGLRAKSDEMIRTQRHLELIADPRVDVTANRYWLACDHYVDVAEHHYKLRAKPTREALVEANSNWRESRDALIEELKPRPRRGGKKPGRIRSWVARRRTMAFLKTVTKLET